MRRHAALIGALCTVCITACSEETGPNISGVPDLDIIKVQVSPSLDTMFVADTLRTTDRLQMAASVIGRLGPIPNAAVAWASSNTEVATVTEGGLVIPTGYGSTVISASASQVGKATIVVMPAARVVQITPASDTIFVEDPIAARDSVRLTAKAFDSDGKPITGVAFAWTSSGTTTATVNAAGSVLARSLGVVTITATSGDRVGTASVRVASAVKTVQVSSPAATVLAKDTVQLTATALGWDDRPMGGRAFTWSSSNPTIATVDANGRVIFLRAGTATFTAKSAFTTNAVTINALERQFQSIDIGADFSCGFTNLGRGYCWGVGSVGQLGSAADSTCFGSSGGGQLPCTLSPKRVTGPTLEFTAIQAGGVFACGITKDKLVYCWGDNTFGEIGNGGKGAGAQPALATVGQVRFDSIAVGRTHACALSTTKQVYCWGNDSGGEQGEPPTINSTTPIPVPSSLAFSAVTAGDNHTCAIANGAAYCWGSNSSGQLGNGSVGGASSVPVQVSGNASFVSISAGGNHTCGLTTTGSAVCWGSDVAGESGPLSAGDVATTAEEVSGESFVQISAGRLHTCALSSAGTAFCWGSGAWGQTGNLGAMSPSAVTGSVVFRSITSGDRHSCALGMDGETYCWGSNVYGALGNELQAAFRTAPQKVAAPR
jgi:alpha-tubulin suppressor-like RCC1 family protein